MKFQWHPNEAPPSIEPASKAKLAVFRAYLRSYFDRLNVNPSRDEFRIDLVDGFSGGGIFRGGSTTVDGTPLIMLEETEYARDRLNRKRSKPLRFSCTYHFVDKAREHTDYLRRVLTERGYQVEGGNIQIHTNSFASVAGRIIEEVSRRQPRAGRAIFLLDQTGYSQARLSMVRQIFRDLPKAEVILTFAADALVNYLPKTPEELRAVSSLELPVSRLRELIEYRDGLGGRPLIQRVLRDSARSITGARFDTPFFIRPAQSRRALWFLHLSQHPTARDVMIQRHWDLSNTFEHYGNGGIGMLGWDELQLSETFPIFRFGDIEREQIRDQLSKSLPGEIHRLASEEPVSVSTFRQEIANSTAARFSDIDEALILLSKGGEIEIRTRDGRLRSRAITRLPPSDTIGRSDTRVFPMFSRFRELEERR